MFAMLSLCKIFKLRTTFDYPCTWRGNMYLITKYVLSNTFKKQVKEKAVLNLDAISPFHRSAKQYVHLTNVLYSYLCNKPNTNQELPFGENLFKRTNHDVEHVCYIRINFSARHIKISRDWHPYNELALLLSIE